MKRIGSSLVLDGIGLGVDQGFAALPIDGPAAGPTLAMAPEAVSATAPETAALPADPLFASEWWLRNTGQSGGTPGKDIDVAAAWTVATGAGVTIVVNDTGIDYSNPDIAPNYDAVTSQSLDAPTNDGYPHNSDNLTGTALSDLAHGTWVAGLIAAADDNVGIVGVAYNATVSAFRLIETAADQSDPWGSTAAALTNSANFDIANNSWEFTSALADSVFDPGASTATGALLSAATNGRGGLGTINVFAAGNHYQSGDDTNLHAFQSSINVVTVAALDANGTVNAPGGRYSTPGASILVSAPGTDITSDTIVGQGNLPGSNLESGLDGTSFATPLVSGVVALMLQANPNLGLRDVQQILAYTARLTDPADSSWLINDAVNWNGGGLHVSDDYGFGLVDAAAAVALARSWTTQHTIGNRTIDFVNAQAVGAIASTGTTFSFVVPPADSLTLDWVRVQLSLDFTTFDNLHIVLTSPGGASSVLLNRPDDGMGASFFNNTMQLTSDQFWGQGSTGTWQVTIGDANPAFGDFGTLFSAGLVLVGDPPPARNTFIYTDEYAAEAAVNSSREELNDPGSTGDTLNLAAVTKACVIDLVPGGAGNIGGASFAIGAGTVIDNVITGSGSDTIDVNAFADTITSEGGSDTVVFAGPMASYALGRIGTDQVTVTLGGITDTLNGITTLQFADRRVPTSDIVACFAEGTRIYTERGDVAVENLRIGEHARTQPTNGYAEIIWTGRRCVDCERHPRPHLVWPVRIAVGAFGEGTPARDLYLSPDHAVYVNGMLIPVKHLINGTTIGQVQVSAITYFHVELSRHDVLLAESLPVESYLDIGDRSVFGNGGAATQLHPDFASRIWEAEGCAPLVITGPLLTATRRHLCDRAAGLRAKESHKPRACTMIGCPGIGVSHARPRRKQRHRSRPGSDGQHAGPAPEGDHGCGGAPFARIRS